MIEIALKSTNLATAPSNIKLVQGSKKSVNKL